MYNKDREKKHPRFTSAGQTFPINVNILSPECEERMPHLLLFLIFFYGPGGAIGIH